MTAAEGAAVRWPAEWEPHAATWLAYPHLASDWPGKLSAVRWAFVEIVRLLQRHEAVRLLVRDAREAGRVRSVLRRGGTEPDLLDIRLRPTDRAWVRDTGPTFVERDGRLEAVCWRFSGWGRYANWQLDAQVGRFVAEAAGTAWVEPQAAGRRVVLEGGAIEGDGCGTVLTTEPCLLAQGRYARNPGLAREDLERVLEAVLGARQVLWLGAGIAGDDTSGHIDNLARFVGPRRVAAIVETDRRDENYAPLRDNLRRLRGMRDARGRSLELVELPMPRTLRFAGCRLPASYANFYVANGLVLVPTFNDPNDRAALRILAECFPDREVCGVHSADLALGQGGPHCLAQQQPAAIGGRLRRPRR